MGKSLRIAACALSAALVLAFAGCAFQGKIISGGYLPEKITNIEEGGEFDSSKITPHETGEVTLEKIQGFWVYEGIVGEDGSITSTAGDSAVVTDKAITLNEEKIECLPKSVDIRPYSPMTSLYSQGFGYGAAVFESAEDDSVFRIQMETMPYSENGFICTINENTLALGFLNAEAAIDRFGRIADWEDNAISECSLTEVDYEISLDGDRLTLAYDGVSASYVLDSSLWMEPRGFSTFGTLCEGDDYIPILGMRPRGLLGKGFQLDCNMDEMLPSCSVSEAFMIKTPGGASMTVKVVNPYEKTVPIGYSEICWYEYEGDKPGGLTLGSHATDPSNEFGVAAYADIYNLYGIPYEAEQDLLWYKTGYILPMLKTVNYNDGYDTGELLLESERSCDVRFRFKDNVLSSISVSDPVYLNGGLQDNIAHDDLDDLEPSVYKEAAEQRDDILDQLKKAFEDAGVDVAINETTGEIVMDNNVLFATDSYELGAEGKAYLEKFFTAYSSVVLDEKYSGVLKEISFEGNTDSDGDSGYNMMLSENRANAVMEYCSSLLDEKQGAMFNELAASRGYGESDLVYDEDGYEDKDASRRVAIKFILNVDDL